MVQLSSTSSEHGWWGNRDREPGRNSAPMGKVSVTSGLAAVLGKQSLPPSLGAEVGVFVCCGPTFLPSPMCCFLWGWAALCPPRPPPPQAQS